MSIQVQCVQCGTTHQVNNRLAGRRVRCPGCDTAIHVPELDSQVEADAVEVEAIEIDAADSVEVEAVIVDADLAETVELQPDPEFTARPAVPSVSATSVAITPSDAIPSSSDELDDDDAYPKRPERQEEELDMTPMVDVTFLLLIFFMVTASFSLQKSIEMPRQQTDAPSTQAIEEDPEELDQVELQIDEFGGFLVLAADWEAETPGKQNLISKLKEARTDGIEGKLIIKVHEQAKLQALVDGMDAGTIAGYAELQVTQVEQFD